MQTNQNKIILRNAVLCHNCNTVTESEYRNDFRSCDCGNCTVDGGHDYFRHIIIDNQEHTNLSECYDVNTEHELIRTKFKWTSRFDSEGNKLVTPVTKPICDLEDSHIANIMLYLTDCGSKDSTVYAIFQNEVEYRTEDRSRRLQNALCCAAMIS